MIPSLLESHLSSTLQYAEHFYFPSHSRHGYSSHNMKQQEIHVHIYPGGQKGSFSPREAEKAVWSYMSELDRERCVGPELRDWP